MSEQRASSPSPARRSASQEQDPKIAQGQKNAQKAMQKRKKRSFLDKYAYHLVIGGFLLLCASALFSIFFSKSKKIHLTPVIDEEDITAHNSENLGFTLGPNAYFEGYKLSDAKPLFNNQFSFKSSLLRCASSEESTIIEDSYDFREKFPDCVNPIHNQGNCSSSYAVTPASVLSNRYCALTGKFVDLSPQTYLGCEPTSKNCEGGAVANFLDYAKKEGIPELSCTPYTGDKNKTCPEDSAACLKYNALEYCVSSTAETIKREILKNGPVVAVIPVYRDFLIYKDGIYRVIEGTSRFQGGHAIKVLGWGQEEGREYWIIENTWGDSWGVNGYGKVAIGENDLYIDNFVMAVTPRVDKVETVSVDGSTTTTKTSQDSNVETENLDN